MFFKSDDPKKQQDWYRDHLGIDAGEYGTSFKWRHHDDPEKEGATAWTTFPSDTKYLEPSDRSFMINYRVHDLVGLLQALAKEGVQQVGEMLDEDYGRFAWIMDPEGNKIELWEPVDKVYAKMLEEEESGHDPDPESDKG